MSGPRRSVPPHPAEQADLAAARAELSPGGVLRAAINMGNPLLVSGTGPTGEPEGIASDMAREVARALDVEVAFVPFARPGDLADAAGQDVWDIGLIAMEAARADAIAFTPAYSEIEATYLVPEASPLRSQDDIDRPGMRIAVSARSAYDLWLTRNIVHAELLRANGLEPAFRLFKDEGLDALAGLRPALLSNQADLPGSRILDGRFTAVQQAIGTSRTNVAAIRFLAAFVQRALESGLVADILARHGGSHLAVRRCR